MVQQKISTFLRGRGLVFPYTQTKHTRENTPEEEIRTLKQRIDRKEKGPTTLCIKKIEKPESRPKPVMYTHDPSCPGPSHARVFYIPKATAVRYEPLSKVSIEDFLGQDTDDDDMEEARGPVNNFLFDDSGDDGDDGDSGAYDADNEACDDDDEADDIQSEYVMC